MSDSVGKISLDLEIKSDLGKQISSMSGLISKNLKNSLNASTKSMFAGMEKNASKSVRVLDSSIKSMIGKMRGNLKNTMKAVFESVKNVKLPPIKFQRQELPKPNLVNEPETKNFRGPPKNIDKEVLKTQIEGTERELDIVNAKIDQQKEKLLSLKESFKSTFNLNTKNKINEQILKTEGNINKLISKSDKLGFKLAELDSKFASANNGANKLSNGSNNVKKSLDKVNKSIKDNNNSMRSHKSTIGMIARSMFTWGIVFPMVLSGLKSMATGIFTSLKTNEQFANSLAQIKSNLMIAFMPIYEAILPAINALMSAISIATQYIASFISAIFGKTFNQSKQATQGLIDAKTAMGAYGKSAKETGKAVKDSLGLASFDEINALNSQKDKGNNGGGSGGGADIPVLVTPPLDTSAVDKSMKDLVDRIKAYFKTFNFQPLIASFKRVKTSVTPIIMNIGKIIKWFLTDILDPLAHWTITDLLPAFLNLLSGALDVLNPILEVFMDLGKWLWDEFLQPIASWTGGLIVSVLNQLADILTQIGKWISEHKPLVEDLTLVLGSFALAWGLVTLAMSIWTGISGIAALATEGLAIALASIEWPVIIVIAVIGAMIAIGLLLYKHWDEIKAKAQETWNYVKEKFNEFKEWLHNVFTTDWTSQFGWMGNILNGFLAAVKSVIYPIKQIFNGLIDFIAGVFTGNWDRAWQGVKSIFSGIMGSLDSVIKAPLNGVIGLINAAIDGLNGISINIPNWVPKYGGSTFGVNIPKVPYLAKGGIIDSPTLAMVGEAGKEAVVPLENNTQGLDLLAAKLIDRLGSGKQNSNDSFGAGDLILQIDGTVIGKVALKQLRKMQRQGNITLIPT